MSEETAPMNSTLASADPRTSRPEDRRSFLQRGGAVIGAAALGPLAAPAVIGQPRKLDLVKGTFSPLVSYAPLYVAVEKGFFAKYGIENQIDNVAIAASLPLVARGDYDWGRSSNGPGYFNALNSGLGIFGAVDRLTYLCSADNSLVVSAQRHKDGLRSFADLKGRTIGINAPGTATYYWLSVSLRQHKMTRADIRVAHLGYPELLAALTNGAVDAGYMSEPLLTQGLLDGKIKEILPVVDVAKGDNIGVMFFGRAFVEKQNGDLANRWTMAWLEGARFAQDRANRNEVIRMISKWTKVDVAALEACYDRKGTWPQVDPNGRVDVDRMMKGLGQYFLETKEIDKLPPPDRVFDPRFVNAALKQLGEVPVGRYQVCTL